MVKSLVFHFQRMLTTFNGDGEYFDGWIYPIEICPCEGENEKGLNVEWNFNRNKFKDPL